MNDPSEFVSTDELGDCDYMDYLEEFHPVLTSEDLDELENTHDDYIAVEEVATFQPLDFDDIPV